MTGREIIDSVLDKRGLIMTLGSKCAATWDIQIREEYGKLIDKEINNIRNDIMQELKVERVVTGTQAIPDGNDIKLNVRSTVSKIRNLNLELSDDLYSGVRVSFVMSFQDACSEVRKFWRIP